MKQKNRRLKKLLSAKEKHYLLQKHLFKKYQAPIVTINLNIPGVNKQQVIYKKFFKQIKKEFFIFLKINKITYVACKNKNNIAGNFLIVVLLKELNCQYLKRNLLELELKDSNYQLVDIDVYDQDNQKISRTDLKYPLKKCYLCSNSAKFCARAKKHDLDLLLSYVDSVVNQALDKYQQY